MRARLTGASGKRTIWRLPSGVVEENGETRRVRAKRGGKESEGGLGVSAGRYPEWQASTAQLAVSRCVRGTRGRDREKEGEGEYGKGKRERGCVCVYRVSQKLHLRRTMDVRSQSRPSVLESRTTGAIGAFLRAEFPRDWRVVLCARNSSPLPAEFSSRI